MRDPVRLAFIVGVAVSVLALTVDGSFRIDELRPRRPVDVGSSQILIANTVELDLYRKIFPEPVPAALTLTVRTYRANGRRTLANVHRTLTGCDGTFADGVRAYLGTVLRRYNRTAHRYLTAVGVAAAGEPATTTVVRLIGDAFGYPFFAYLSDARFDVRSTYDNVLLYTSPYVGGRLSGTGEQLLGWIEQYGTAVEGGARYVDVKNPKNENVVKIELGRLETELRKLSFAFRKSYPQWLRVYDPERLPGLPSPDLLDFWNSVNEAKCTLLIDIKYGFMSHPDKMPNDVDGFDTEDLSDNFKIYTITQFTLMHLVKIHKNINNVLIFNNILIEMYIFIIGLISNRLFEGANHFLYKYCITLKNEDEVYLALQNLEYIRVYLRLFLILLNKTISRIIKDLNIDVTNNFFLNSMVQNLTEMIGISSILNYHGENDFEKIIKMKNRMQSVYDMTDKVYIAGLRLNKLKSHYIVSSVILMNELLNWLN